MRNQAPARILFICLGNICRSPAAEGVFAALVAAAGRGGEIVIDSAGTGGWHAGSLPDPRMREAGSARGYALTHRARQVQAEDFERFDLLLTMDDANYANVTRLAPSPALAAKVRKFCSYCQESSVLEVPDPYYGERADFDRVLDILEDGCRGLLADIATPASRRGIGEA